MTEKYNCFLYKQLKVLVWGLLFLTAFSEKCSHWIICLLACFSPQLFPQQLFTICRQQNLSKRFVPLARFKKGTAVRSCAWTFCVLIFLLWKVSLAKLYNLTTKNLQPQLLSPSNGYYWTLLLSKMNTDSKYFPFAFFQWIARLQQLNRINFCLSRKCNILLL